MPRKKPFSGKQKKFQLQVKKREGSQTRQHKQTWSLQDQIGQKRKTNATFSDTSSEAGSHNGVPQEGVSARDRYRLNFLRETRGEIETRKLQAQTETLIHVTPKSMEMAIEEVYHPGSELDMPQRPHWDYKDSKNAVEKREEAYFAKYLDDIYSKFAGKHLSYFEHNLETWRQLWRVLEMSDVIVMVADVRHPILHFSPALYNYATEIVKKPIILVLNKIDLVPAPVVIAWKNYFETKFTKLHVITFSSFPKNLRAIATNSKITKKRPVGKRVYSTQIGPQELFEVCKKICEEKVDLQTWEEKIINDLKGLHCYNEETGTNDDSDTGEAMDNEMFKNGRLTLGFVGHPNVGKSSLMNGLIGKKVVSTSVTPGHTKYFQTYFLTQTVKLCDCPGLVFPSLVDKQMQILSGIYPISQVQEPYTPVGYLASRIPVVKLLKVVHPNYEGAGELLEWTAWDVCEAWAEKRRFYTAKGRRPDVYRAANHILRMAVDGRLCMFMLPPGYVEDEISWVESPETEKLLSLIMDPKSVGALDGNHGDDELADSEHDSSDSDDDSDNLGHGDGKNNILVQNKFALLGED